MHLFVVTVPQIMEDTVMLSVCDLPNATDHVENVEAIQRVPIKDHGTSCGPPNATDHGENHGPDKTNDDNDTKATPPMNRATVAMKAKMRMTRTTVDMNAKIRMTRTRATMKTKMVMTRTTATMKTTMPMTRTTVKMMPPTPMTRSTVSKQRCQGIFRIERSAQKARGSSRTPPPSTVSGLPSGQRKGHVSSDTRKLCVPEQPAGSCFVSKTVVTVVTRTKSAMTAHLLHKGLIDREEEEEEGERELDGWIHCNKESAHVKRNNADLPVHW